MPTPTNPRDPLDPTPVVGVDPRAVEPRPSRLAAQDRLGLICASPGPYVSAFLRTRPLTRSDEPDLVDRWGALRARLSDDGAPDHALEAVDARLGLPMPPETAAIGVIAAADGRTVVDHAFEPPRHDHAVVDELPYAAPFIEWDQRRVPHLVVVADEEGIDIVDFHPDRRAEIASAEGSVRERALEVRRRARELGCRLVVVGGSEPHAQRLADVLVPLIAPRCNVVVELEETSDGLAAATVRHVTDSVATSTVGFLREFRFLAEHDAAVDGMEDSISALRTGEPGVLLIHDDPADDRRVWIGPQPTDLSVTPVEGWTRTARFVDAAICAAVASNVRVHVIPSTGADGPDDGAAVIRRDTPELELV